MADMNKYPVSREFMDKFAPQYKAVNDFVSRKIGTISRTIINEEMDRIKRDPELCKRLGLDDEKSSKKKE